MQESSGKEISPRKVAIAGFVGTAIEWYDFFLYQYATGTFFVDLFFPHGGTNGTIYAFGAYATGFIARPVGAVVCGYFGDRIGRKSMLVYTLLLIGVSTFLIGCLPTYESIGIWAPILLVLLRLAQGFAVGGEWGGAVLMAVEHSPADRRGFFGSFPQIGVPLGLFLATAVFTVLSSFPKDVLIGQGIWRIGFLSSAVLLLIGLYIRLEIKESPLFVEIQDRRQQSENPILDAIRKHPRNLMLAVGAKLAENAAFFIYTAFILALNITYGRLKNKESGLYATSDLFVAIGLASLIGLVTIPLFGWLSDSIGRRRVYLLGLIVSGLFIFPFFALFESGDVSLMTFGVVVALSFGHAAMYGPQASFFSELFSTEVRYSGASLGYQLAAVIGGTFPLVALLILTDQKGTGLIGLIFLAMVLVSAVSVYYASETFRRKIG